MQQSNSIRTLTAEQHRVLEAWVRAPTTPQSTVTRAKIVLLAAAGETNTSIAKRLSVSRPTVILWQRRFATGGPRALTTIAPGRGRKATISAEKVEAIVNATRQTTPPAATHWSCRTMAKAQGVSKATINRIWRAHGLQPHRIETFKLSTDPLFVEKLRDVVGLYLRPPEHALVLCVDEKSQIQALDRTQPGLPLKKGRCGTLTHDYKRHGTTTLFAALNVLDGTVIGDCRTRHRHEEFLRFLQKIDHETPSELALHLIVDNYATHKHEDIQTWLAKHPRFTLHFIPTSSSWLNLVERWFREITDKRIRRGVFRSVPELVAAIDDYLTHNNSDPKPFVWTKSVDAILEKVGRCKSIIETLH
jgi:transposase